MKYSKSNKCLICMEEISNDKRDGRFLCYDCIITIKKEIEELLQKSNYKDKIKNISLISSSGFGVSNKTTTIKLSAIHKRNIYVQMPTDKILQIRDLKDQYLLFEYIEAEIKCQYALQLNSIKKQITTYDFYNGCYNEVLEEERMLNNYNNIY